MTMGLVVFDDVGFLLTTFFLMSKSLKAVRCSNKSTVSRCF